MKTNILPGFDISFSFDNNLQEVPNNPESYYRSILHLEKEASNENDNVKKSQMLSEIGVMYRIHGDNIKSEEYLIGAIKLIDKSKEIKTYLISTIRLAHTYQKQKRFELSSGLFNETDVLCNENDNLKSYRDFVYQHIGKLKFDMKEYHEALKYFEKALRLREIKGDKELLSSTYFAIQITKNKLSG